jgi:secreted Zn-dependent insulinase-like peptidase
MDIDSARSANDLKDYRVVTTPSGLECLLVSTKEKCALKQEDNTKATAAMAVQVGSFADPAVAGNRHLVGSSARKTLLSSIFLQQRVARISSRYLLNAQVVDYFSNCNDDCLYQQHMVFMGSAKYPVENHYDSFITSHGGSCNAFTEGEYTAYEFDVNAEYFDEALDIFGNCFIAPSLARAAADREINAIDSEFLLATVEDGSRQQQLYCHQARDGHILRKFSWGNVNSLKHQTERAGVDLHGILREFHSLHYVPANMKLVVLAPQSLDDLAALVGKCFDKWENPFIVQNAGAGAAEEKHGRGHSLSGDDAEEAARGAKKMRVDDGLSTPSISSLNLTALPDAASGSSISNGVPPAAVRPLEECVAIFREAPVMEDAALGVLTRVVPLKSTHKLMMIWQLPSLTKEYRSKPAGYVAHVLGHEGSGSVLSYLKSESLATGLSAGVSESNFDDNSMFSLFEVSVQLTERGLANWVYVAQAVHAYLRMLRVNPLEKRIFDEVQQVCNLAYRKSPATHPLVISADWAMSAIPVAQVISMKRSLRSTWSGWPSRCCRCWTGSHAGTSWGRRTCCGTGALTGCAQFLSSI